MPMTISIPALRKLDPCTDGFRRARTRLREVRAKGPYSAADARAAQVDFNDVVWTAQAIAAKAADVKRRLRLWTADCAAHVLAVYEKTSSDPAPRHAILAARRFARGEIHRLSRFRAMQGAWEAYCRVRFADMKAAEAAAAAAFAADEFYAAPAACARAAVGMVGGATDAEQTWQYDRLVLWLSDDEPADQPLPERGR